MTGQTTGGKKGLNGVTIQIQRVRPGDLKLNLLLYGLPGVGKTTLALQANDHPAMAPALVLNLEGGLLSVASRGDVDEVPIRSTREFEDALIALANKQGDFAKYRTVIIDSGSELAKRSLSEKTKLNTERQLRRKTEAERAKDDRTEDDIQIEDYGKMTAQMRRLFTMARDLPVHTIVTSLVRFVYPQTKDGGKASEPSEVTPDFTAGLQISVMGMFDMVWYMYANTERQRFLMTQTIGAYRAKTRGAKFAQAIIDGDPKNRPIINDPSLPFIYDALLLTEGAINVAPNGDKIARADVDRALKEEIDRVKAEQADGPPKRRTITKSDLDELMSDGTQDAKNAPETTGVGAKA